VTRCRLVDVATTRARAAVLLAGEGPGVPPADAVRLLLVGEGRPYDRREIAAAVGLPVAGALPWDATGAAVYSDGAPRPRRGSKLDRAIAAAAASMSAWLADRPALRGAA
jgi:hypothetical protein